MFLFCETFDLVKRSKLSEFKRFIVNDDSDLVEILTTLKAIVVDTGDGFYLANTNGKIKRNPGDSIKPLGNKCRILADTNTESNGMEADNFS